MSDVSTTATPRSDTSVTSGRRARTTTWLVVVLVLATIGVVYARARWPGALPLGSDNDEYQLAGRALAAFEAPLVAGVEGTKYPLGYPALLAALQWLRLPVAAAAIALNLAALALTVGIVARLAGRATDRLAPNPGAALAAGSVVAASVAVWNDAYSVMPELGLIVLVATMLVVLERPLTARRLLALSVLAVAAVLLKTLAILLVLGGCGLLWLVAGSRLEWLAAGRASPRGAGREVGPVPPARRRGPAPLRLLLPGGAALVTVLAGMAAVRSLPEHTTGYLATFFLRDPFDASAGELGPLGLLRRTVTDVPDTFRNLGRSIALIEGGTALATVVALVALTLGVVAAFRLRPGAPLGVFVVGATLAYVLGMMLWPYHSSRFGLPLVPIAALGAGWLVRVVTDPRGGEGHDGALEQDRPAGAWASLAAGGVVTALLVASSWGDLVDHGEAAADRLASQHAAMEQLETFSDPGFAEARLVSFDYREVAHRLDRPVQPLAYTSDTDALLEQVGDADYVVKVDIHHVRNRQLGLLLNAEPDRFVPLLDEPSVAVYRVER